MSNDNQEPDTEVKRLIDQEPTAWLCIREGDGDYEPFAYTLEQLTELGYGNISTKPFKKIAPLYTGKAIREQTELHNTKNAIIIDQSLKIKRLESRIEILRVPTMLDDSDEAVVSELTRRLRDFDTTQSYETCCTAAYTIEKLRTKIQEQIAEIVALEIDNMVSAHKIFAKSGADRSLKIDELEAEVARLNGLVTRGS